MKFVVDTNVMLRYLLNDDVNQSAVATRLLSDKSSEFILSTSVLNEVVWFLKNTIKVKRNELIVMLEDLLGRENFIMNNEEVTIGLAFLQASGDFADGIIAYQVSQYDKSNLLTFDKKAQRVAHALGIAVTDPK